jgi:DNA-directed RNA polymerase specialized sigma24 family protein
MIRRKTFMPRYVYLDDDIAGAKEVMESVDGAPDPEQFFIKEECYQAIRKAVSNLRPSVRAVVEVGPLKDHSSKETAKLLNISLAAAKGRLFHARTALRKSTVLCAIMQSRSNPRPIETPFFIKIQIAEDTRDGHEL